MTYQQILNDIFQALPMYHRIGSSAYKEGFENIEALMDVLGHPEKQLRSIHVAGTNGKGSTTHLLSSFFQEMGLKVGLYTSPHLVDFRERIKINGEMIPKEDVVDFFETYQTDFQKIEPSFFEMVTALAFYCFAKEKVDIAIVEVGLGGRLDATNIIRPDLSVITNISFDHTQLLGDTLAKIAFEKAGIIKDGVPVLIGRRQTETMPVFEQQAAAHHAPLHTTEFVRVTPGKPSGSPAFRNISISAENIDLQDVKLPLLGDYQLENVATFVAAVLLHQPHQPQLEELLRRAIENVIVNTHLQGRWQVVCEHPLTICDTGHNSGGFEYLSKQLNELECKELHLVIGFVNDKDIDAIVHLLPRQGHYHVCKASVDRAQEPAVIAEKLASAGIASECSAKSVFQTYTELCSKLSDQDAVYIGGSTFIVADFLRECDSFHQMSEI